MRGLSSSFVECMCGGVIEGGVGGLDGLEVGVLGVCKSIFHSFFSLWNI